MVRDLGDPGDEKRHDANTVSHAQLSKDVRRKGAVDGTVYGTARTSTRSFFVHHLSAVAAGVMHADALTLENAAATLTFLDTRSANRAVVRAP